MRVAELFASFAVKSDRGSFSKAAQSIRQLRNSAITLGAVFGVGALFKGMIGFNASVEDTKRNIAAMLALGSKTTMSSQLENANKLYDSLRKKAADLPGTTEEYALAMAKLTLPIMSAGMGMKELEELTVATVVAAKGGVGGATVKTATTDVLQGIEGRFSTTDFFLKAILEPLDNGKYVGEAGRKLFKGLSKSMRAKEIQRGLSNPVFAELGRAHGASFTGQVDKAKEAWAQFLGAVGKPVFEKLAEVLTRINKWLAANPEKIKAITDAVGNGLVKAFDALGVVVNWFIENSDFLKDALLTIAVIIGGILLKATLAWAATWGPIFLAVMALVKIFQFLQEKIGTVGAALTMVFGALLLTRFGAVVNIIRTMTMSMLGFRAAAIAAGGAGAAINAGALAGGLGAAGRGGAVAAASGGGGFLAGAAGLAKKAPIIGTVISGASAIYGAVNGTNNAESFAPGDQNSRDYWSRASQDASRGVLGREKQNMNIGTYEEILAGQMELVRSFTEYRQQVAPQNFTGGPGAGAGIDASMTIHVAGVNMNQAQLEATMLELQEKQLRHLQNAGGGK